MATVLVLIAGVAAQASADAMRGIFINGQVHVFCNGCDGNGVIQHRAGSVNSSWLWTQNGAAQQITSPAPPDYTTQVGQGLTVMNDVIYYFPLGDPGNSTSNDRYLACVQYDLTKGAWDTTKTKQLSKLHQSGYCNVGSAAVTFDPGDGSGNRVYALCDNATWTTGDGVGWTSHSPLVPNSWNWEPMDAVVFYPPDSDPMILVVYTRTNGQYLNTGLYAALWNGKFDSASQLTTVQLDAADPDTWIGGALVLGTVAAASPYHGGEAAKPAVQLFANRPNGGGVYRWEYAYDASGGAWSAPDSGKWDPSYDEMFAFPWYQPECSSDGSYQITRQHIILNALVDTARESALSSSKALSMVSDAMIPINKDGQQIKCGASWGGSTTDTGADSDDAEELQTWEKYWTLLGVILGSPPFALNGWDSFELAPFSNIEVGADDSTDVSYSEQRDRTLTFSSGLTVTEGLEKLGLDVENEIEVGYKYGWDSGHETSQSWTKTFGKSFGTEGEDTDDPESLGEFGWAIFNVPKMLVQDFAIYAYDFNVNGPQPPGQNGHYLNQDIHSVEVLPDSSEVVPLAFKLDEPGSDEDSVPGLMSGMADFSNSQDLDFWGDPGFNWETPTAGLWAVLLGDHTDENPGGEIQIQSLTFVPGSTSKSGFSEELKNIDTQGQTTAVDINDSFSIAEKCFLGGFKLDLKAGYDSEFKQEVTNSTSWSQNVEASLGMKTAKDETDPSAVKILDIQPYLLKATDPTAPWLPDLYRDQRPWCITWRVTNHEYYVGGGGKTCPPPHDVGAKVVGGNGGAGADSGPKSGEVKVISDCMFFDRTEEGAAGAIPLGADDFDPALGATFTFNRYAYATSQAQGKWTREGQVWKFRTKESAKPRVLLKLDFGSQSWSAEISKVDLSAHFGPSPADVRLTLTVNGRYSSHSAFEPQIRTSWDLKVPAPSPDKVELTRYFGDYDSQQGAGSVTLMGTFPKKPDAFGDISFSVNGHKVDISLTSLDGFESAVERGKEVVYNKGGVHLMLDFGKGTWKAQFAKEGFHPLLAPRGGVARIRISVGGVTVYSQEHAIADHTTKLSFKS